MNIDNPELARDVVDPIGDTPPLYRQVIHGFFAKLEADPAVSDRRVQNLKNMLAGGPPDSSQLASAFADEDFK